MALPRAFRLPHVVLPALVALALLCAPGTSHAAVRATVALTPRDPAALQAYAQAVSDPASPLYHRYLSVAQFARRFGSSPAAISRVRAMLVARGLAPGPVSANRLELLVDSSGAGAAPLAHFRALARVGASAVSWSPLRNVSGLVQAVVGLGAHVPRASVIVKPDLARRRGARPVADTPASPQVCAGARSRALNDGSFTVNQIADRYGLNQLYAAGDAGRGVTVAVYELEPFSSADVAAFQSCFHTAATVSTVPVDGGAGTGPGTGEAAMDVEDVIGLAPDANVRVYEGPSTGTGAYDTYARMVSDDSAQVITTSWGLCESLEGQTAAAAENTLFQEAAVQGQTVLASAGDEGSDDCGNHRQAVDDPASQPWVTGVGATSAQPGGDTVWDDALGASGGGVSELWARPAYQLAAARPQSTTTCGAAATTCREVPDVSADGDPDTGYVIYWRGSWITMGGTSASTPTWAALAALADASPACSGRTLGFANPALYRLAATGYTADFGDVTVGDNSYRGVPGFAAGPGYDMASGLGVPDAATLVPALCGQSLALATPADQRSPVGRPVSLAVHGVGPPATFAARGLPAGLTIDPATGAIWGTPVAAGSFTVTVIAGDAAGSYARTTFRWFVTAGRHDAARHQAVRHRHRRRHGHHGRARVTA